MEIYVKISFISIFLFYCVFKPDFIRCVDFTNIAASNTMWWRHKSGHTEYL